MNKQKIIARLSYQFYCADLILARILRIKQIIQDKGKALIGEDIDTNFYDILK